VCVRLTIVSGCGSKVIHSVIKTVQSYPGQLSWLRSLDWGETVLVLVEVRECDKKVLASLVSWEYLVSFRLLLEVWVIFLCEGVFARGGRLVVGLQVAKCEYHRTRLVVKSQASCVQVGLFPPYREPQETHY